MKLNVAIQMDHVSSIDIDGDSTFVLGLEAERLKRFASFPVALVYYLFWQFAIYRARRYRLTRTVWRGEPTEQFREVMKLPNFGTFERKFAADYLRLLKN